MDYCRIIIILLISISTYGQSATATASVGVTIISIKDIELDSLGNFKIDKYGRLVFKEEVASKYEVVAPTTIIEPILVPKIEVSEKDSIRLMKIYIKKKEKYGW